MTAPLPYLKAWIRHDVVTIAEVASITPTGLTLSSRILESEKAILQTTIILLTAQFLPHLRAVTVL